MQRRLSEMNKLVCWENGIAKNVCCVFLDLFTTPSGDRGQSFPQGTVVERRSRGLVADPTLGVFPHVRSPGKFNLVIFSIYPYTVTREARSYHEIMVKKARTMRLQQRKKATLTQ